MIDPLLIELGELLRGCDPVPASVIADAEAAYALMLASSAWIRLEPSIDEPALVRADARTFLFASKEIRIRIQLRGSDLIGLVSPVLDVEVRWPAGARRVRLDEFGLFHVDGLPPGPLRLIVDETHATPWFRP